MPTQSDSWPSPLWPGVMARRWDPAGLPDSVQALPLRPQLPRPHPGPSFSLPQLAPRPCPPSLLPLPQEQPFPTSAASACHPALSFTHSHLFRDSYPQYSALLPQRSPGQLTQCLGASAAVAVAGPPGQLNTVARPPSGWGSLGHAVCCPGPCMHRVSPVCSGRDLCAQPQSSRHRHRTPGWASARLRCAHRWFWELQVPPTPGAWLRPRWKGHRLVADKTSSPRSHLIGILSTPQAMRGSPLHCAACTHPGARAHSGWVIVPLSIGSPPPPCPVRLRGPHPSRWDATPLSLLWALHPPLMRGLSTQPLGTSPSSIFRPIPICGCPYGLPVPRTEPAPTQGPSAYILP